MIFPTMKALIAPSVTSFVAAFFAALGFAEGDLANLLAWQLFGAGGCFIGLYLRSTEIKVSRIWAIFIISQIVSLAAFSQDFTDILILDKISRPLLSLIFGIICADPAKAKNWVMARLGYGVKK